MLEEATEVWCGDSSGEVGVAGWTREVWCGDCSGKTGANSRIREAWFAPESQRLQIMTESHKKDKACV